MPVTTGSESEEGAPLGSIFGSAMWATMIAETLTSGSSARSNGTSSTRSSRLRPKRRTGSPMCESTGGRPVAGKVLAHGHDAGALEPLDVVRLPVGPRGPDPTRTNGRR